jgi:hypothetical protein
MHPEIRNIIPLYYEFEPKSFEALNEHVTFIIQICEDNSPKVYSLEDWIDTLNLNIKCKFKLRYDEQARRPTISAGDCGRLTTTEPRGLVLNMTEVEAEKFEKLLLFPLLTQEGDAFTVVKINNCEIARNIEQKKIDIFNSFFSVE